MSNDTVSSTELTIVREALPPAEITTPAEAELELRRHQAILDVLRRGRASMRDQVVALRGCVEYAVRGADLVDEMRTAGELVAGPGRPAKTSEVRTFTDIDGLTRQRVAEWRSLRDNDAIAFIDQALADGREDTLKRASGLNWLRERIERIARETATPPDYVPDYDYELRHGDLRNTLDDLTGTVDAIITDPPYGAAFFDEIDALGDLAARLLRPGGLLVAMVGQTHLPTYLERLSRHLTYRWCGAYLCNGPATRVHGRKVGSKWKPLLIYGGDRFLIQDVFADSTGADKRHHDWGQSEDGMTGIVELTTKPGELIVDPFLGAGTTAVVCHDLGRRFVGCDIDTAAVKTARTRLDG